MRSLILLCFCACVVSVYTDDYHVKRAKIIRDEELMSLGGKTILTDKEFNVNNCLMRHKFRETDYAFDNPRYFNFSHHFFSYKDKIKQSKVYAIIKDMPKGAVLHIHDMGLLRPDYLMNITYMDNLYACIEVNDLRLKFGIKAPESLCSSKWKLMSELRNSSGNVEKFDSDLRKHFTLVVDDPDEAYSSITETWTAFMNYFQTVAPMLAYRPVWEQYFYDALKRFKDDNIMYLEVRSVLPNLYELDGEVYDPVITAKSYKKVIKRFVTDYPDFFGAKLIFAPSRYVDRNQLRDYLKLARRLKGEVPEIFAGFDLVGQEDMGKPLLEFVPDLNAASKEFNYFFHAGETDWYGTSTDENLVDAILLGTKRIGHAYAINKHPTLVKEIKEKDIGLEVNVISNNVLSLVRDVRNHPLNVFLAEGLPVVLSSDDPGVWEADPISDDFYVSFVGVASKMADLRMLKTLAMNSLKYSALDESGKKRALDLFVSRWNSFIDNFECSKY